MRTSSTDADLADRADARALPPAAPPSRRARGALVLVAAAALGGAAGGALPAPGTTAALLTAAHDVAASVAVAPCDPAAWEDAVTAAAPVLRWRLDAADLRPYDTPAASLLGCGAGGARDLAPADAGLTADPLPLATPADLTVTLWTGRTDAATAEGSLLELAGGGRDVHVVVVPGGGLEVRYDAAGGPQALVAPSLGEGAHHVALVVDASGVRLAVDGADVATGPAEDAPPAPVGLTLGAAAGVTADVVVDDLLVHEDALTGPALAGLAAAARW